MADTLFTSLGTICTDIPHSTCCQSSQGQLFGSVIGESRNPTDRITLYRKIGNAICGASWGVTHRLSSWCLILGDQINEEHWVGGAGWSRGGGPVRGDGDCEKVVVGDEMFAEGGKILVISRGKMEGLAGGGVEVPREGG